MNELALFAGAGGGILGGKLLGWRTVCAVERDAYAAAVLAQRQNDGILEPFPIWSDIETFDGRPWKGLVDVVSGGFPCQGFSGASRGRRNAQDFWSEMLRVITEVSPRYVFAENTAEVAIQTAADDCESVGYSTKILQASAANVGADHIRKRFWLLAHADSDSKLQLQFDAEVEKLQEFRFSVWQTYAGESGMVDGVAFKMDRLKAIGNGQVPAVVRLAWHTLNCEQ